MTPVGDRGAHVQAGPARAAHDARARDCTILHVDMDAFFASVEVLDDRSLAGKPVVVGGTGARGVVASCTYEARAFGVRSAMPTTEARRRCPHAVFLAGRYARYAEVSERFRQVLERFTPLVEGIGLDEAFLDVSGAWRAGGSPETIAPRVRAEVEEALLLKCSVGVARTKLLAKLASRLAKPQARRGGVRDGAGVVVVHPDEEASFLESLPVRALWGVGPTTAQRLSSLGVGTVGELARVPEAALVRLLGKASGSQLAALARGDDPREVDPHRELKSVGHEETFASDLHSHAELLEPLVRMADAVATRLRDAGSKGRTVTLKLRYSDRATVSRSQTLGAPTCSGRALAKVSRALLETIEVHSGVRLLGVAVSGLVGEGDPGVQLSFAGDKSQCTNEPDPAWEEVEHAVAKVRARYGASALATATLLGSDGIRVSRKGDAQWGPGEGPPGGS